MPDAAPAPKPDQLHDQPAAPTVLPPPSASKDRPGHTFSDADRRKAKRNRKPARIATCLKNAVEVEEIGHLAVVAFRDTVSGAAPGGKAGATKLSRDDAMALAGLMRGWSMAQRQVAFWKGIAAPTAPRTGAKGKPKSVASAPAAKPKNLPPGDPEVD